MSIMFSSPSTPRRSALRRRPTIPANFTRGMPMAQCLPVEIIAEILWNIITVWVNPSREELRYMFRTYRDEIAAFKAAISTCKRWRDVAFDCHPIWGYVVDIDYSKIQWVELALHQSGNHSLAIQSRLIPTQQASWDAIMRHFERIRSLALIPPDSYNILPFNDIFLQTSAPRLEFLEIITHSFSPDKHLIYPLIAPLFQSGAPRLTHFHAEGFYFLWRHNQAASPPVSANMTYLAVIYPNFVPRVHHLRGIEPFRWLPAFQQMPHLEYLHLKNCAHLSSIIGAAQPVTLPKLKFLCILGDTTCVAEILDNISAPTSCQFSITCVTYRPLQATHSNFTLAHALSRIFNQWETETDPPRNWEIGFKSNLDEFQIVVPDRLECTVSSSSRPLPNTPGPQVNLSTLLTGFVQHALHSVRSLHTLGLQLGLANNDVDLTQPLGDFLSRCTGLRVLQLASSYGFPIFSFLQMPWHVVKNNGNGERIWVSLLPALTEITVHEAISQRCDAEFQNYRKWRRGQSMTDVSITYTGRDLS